MDARRRPDEPRVNRVAEQPVQAQDREPAFTADRSLAFRVAAGPPPVDPPPDPETPGTGDALPSDPKASKTEDAAGEVVVVPITGTTDGAGTSEAGSG